MSAWARGFRFFYRGSIAEVQHMSEEVNVLGLTLVDVGDKASVDVIDGEACPMK
jgi:hypothetical protein